MKTLSTNTRGAVMVEYIVVLILVALLAGACIVVMGIAMSRFYAAQQAWLLIPGP